MPTDFIGKLVSNKKKIGHSLELNSGKPSEKKEISQICVAMATPAIAKPKTIPNIVIDLGDPLQSTQNPFKERKSSKNLNTTVGPTINKNVLISTVKNDTSKVDL